MRGERSELRGFFPANGSFALMLLKELGKLFQAVEGLLPATGGLTELPIQRALSRLENPHKVVAG